MKEKYNYYNFKNIIINYYQLFCVFYFLPINIYYIGIYIQTIHILIYKIKFIFYLIYIKVIYSIHNVPFLFRVILSALNSCTISLPFSSVIPSDVLDEYSLIVPYGVT